MNRNERNCILWFCDRKAVAHGLCLTHYQNIRRHGDYIAPKEIDQVTMRDRCEAMADAVMMVFDQTLLSGQSCPVCQANPGESHRAGCAMDYLFSLASQVKGSRVAVAVEVLSSEPGLPDSGL